MKRLFDLLFSLFILGLFLPIGIVLAFFILIESRGGVFYKQERVGKNAQIFKLYKFRTMRVNADQAGLLTVGMRDTRITRMGYFLRKYKLDEFPQFINVLKGEMSIVGPRPEVQQYVDHYTKEQREVLEVRPGITDYASLAYFDENKLLGESVDPQKTYIEEIMPKKLELNQKYISNPSRLKDLQLIFQTAKKMILG